MGGCASKTPQFPEASTANDVYPTPETPEDFVKISLIPQQGMMSISVGVFLDGDTDVPSYFFKPVGGQFHLQKINKASQTSDVASDSVEKGSVTKVATIKQGWQSSKGDEQNDLDTATDRGTTITTSITKKMTVVTKINGAETSVSVKKTFQKGGSKCEMSDGFTKHVLEEERCGELRQNERTVAKIFDTPPKMM